jgi:hypothetical protein
MSALSKLPLDLIEPILYYLDWKSALILSKTNRFFYKIILSRLKLWKYYYSQVYWNYQDKMLDTFFRKRIAYEMCTRLDDDVDGRHAITTIEHDALFYIKLIQRRQHLKMNWETGQCLTIYLQEYIDSRLGICILASCISFSILFQYFEHDMTQGKPFLLVLNECCKPEIRHLEIPGDAIRIRPRDIREGLSSFRYVDQEKLILIAGHRYEYSFYTWDVKTGKLLIHFEFQTILAPTIVECRGNWILIHDKIGHWRVVYIGEKPTVQPMKAYTLTKGFLAFGNDVIWNEGNKTYHQCDTILGRKASSMRGDCIELVAVRYEKMEHRFYWKSGMCFADGNSTDLEEEGNVEISTRTQPLKGYRWRTLPNGRILFNVITKYEERLLFLVSRTEKSIIWTLNQHDDLNIEICSPDYNLLAINGWQERIVKSHHGRIQSRSRAKAILFINTTTGHLNSVVYGIQGHITWLGLDQLVLVKVNQVNFLLIDAMTGRNIRCLTNQDIQISDIRMISATHHLNYSSDGSQLILYDYTVGVK